MKIVYQAENIVDAHLVKGTLEQHDIVAFVTGEYLTGAMGELPVAGLLTVMVSDDNQLAAERVIRELLLDRASATEFDFPADADWSPKPV